MQELKEEQERYFNNKFYRLWVDSKGFLLPRARKLIRTALTPFGLKI